MNAKQYILKLYEMREVTSHRWVETVNEVHNALFREDKSTADLVSHASGLMIIYRALGVELLRTYDEINR